METPTHSFPDICKSTEPQIHHSSIPRSHLALRNIIYERDPEGMQTPVFHRVSDLLQD